MWNTAADEVIIPEAPPTLDEPGLLASIEEGRKLFQDAKAQCVQCHGPTALGDGAEPRFDVWNEGKNDENIAFYSLPKQRLIPRNLRSGVYRGGRRPMDLYRRIQAGIKGAQMPSMGQTPAKPSGLSPEEIWHLVHYVQSLPYEGISETGEPQQSVQRDLN
jgi:mono/diheme cytochrome c family protein